MGPPQNSRGLLRPRTGALRLSPSCGLLSKCAASVAAILLSCSSLPATAGEVPAGFTEHFAEVNGVRLHYFIGGKGSPVVLLHGYAETSHMWLPIMPLLPTNHTVIVPDLRGAGASSKPERGYDKKNMAVDIHELVLSLGFKRASIVGHDIGLMVAYAYAKGRERIYFEHFWNDFAADPNHSIPEADRRFYAKAYAQPGGMRAGFEYFRNFEQDAKDFAQLSATPLPMPVLVLTGEKASGNFLIEQARLVATNVQGQIVNGSGHWLMEEAPQAVIPAILKFLNTEPSKRPTS